MAKLKNKSLLRTIGFIVNPISGMGGTVGLKGTDGKEILQKALELGAKPLAPLKAESFLSMLEPYKENIELIVGPGIMGEDEAKKFGFKILVLINKKKKDTSPEDTKNIAKKIKDQGADLLIFCGGDGTARDLLEAIGTDSSLPILGVPTGVKMHSSVFGNTPEAAAVLATNYLFNHLPLIETEIMDVNEDDFRQDRLSSKLYGFVLSPYDPTLIQGIKMSSFLSKNEVQNQVEIALYIIENMEKDALYIIGPGTTTRTIADLLGEKKTLLGVDLFLNKKNFYKDVNEKEIMKNIRPRKKYIIVTPIGGQGFIFGRGNQQISSRIIKKVGIKNIIVVATKYKLSKLNVLRIDSESQIINKQLKGRVKVIVGYREDLWMNIE